MKKYGEQNFSSIWIKFNDYQAVQIDEKTYITPKETAKKEIYDPFDKSDKILVDILRIGRLIEQDDNLNANKEVLEFVKNYGLLGEMTYLPLNNNIIEQDKVYLPKNNLILQKEVLSVTEYISEFLKCDTKHKIKIEKELDDSISVTTKDEVNSLIALDMPLEFSIVFSKVYSECMVWIMHYAYTLYRTFDAIENYYKQEDDYAKQMKSILIKEFKASNIACRVLVGNKPTDKPVLEWNFNSLKQAIDVMFALNETTERKTVKGCKHCGNPFHSENLKAEYCSPQCRNKANVYKTRARKK